MQSSKIFHRANITIKRYKQKITIMANNKRRILIVPDVHGTKLWKDYITRQDFDECYFLGDYFDNFENDWSNTDDNQITNFEEICKEASMDKRIHLCIGNHDIDYIDNQGICSGHQYVHEKDIRDVINKHILLLNIAYYEPYSGSVISHAGISKTWFNDNIYYFTADNNSIETTEDKIYAINRTFKEMRMFSIFGFISKRISEDSSGNNIWQSPLWIRPFSLSIDSMFNKQIVGHSELNNYSNYLYISDNNNDNKIYLFDNHKHQPSFYEVLDDKSIKLETEYV